MSWSVALNGRFSGTLQPTGTQITAFQLFDAIVRAPARQMPLTIFADPAFPGISGWQAVPGVRLVEIPFSRWSRGRAQLWEQLALPGLCARLRCRVAHHPITTSPVINREIKSIVTLHDLNFLLHPKWYTSRFRAVYRVTALPGLRRADLVVAVSNHVRDQAARYLKLPSQRLRCIYNGVRADRAVPMATVASNPTYLLSVGSLQPHKNLRRLIQAFASLRRDWPSLELWIVGRPQPRFRREVDLFSRLATPGVKVLGYLNEDALSATYRNAAVFCYPSLEEGFGLPVPEAMQAGVPVVTSNCSCLPEIAGPAAELADPYSANSIAAAIKKVLTLSPEEREGRVHLAKQWARQFSWSAAAEAYLENYARLLGQSSRQHCMTAVG